MAWSCGAKQGGGIVQHRVETLGLAKAKSSGEMSCDGDVRPSIAE